MHAGKCRFLYLAVNKAIWHILIFIIRVILRVQRAIPEKVYKKTLM
jgi:hypothetical protein